MLNNETIEPFPPKPARLSDSTTTSSLCSQRYKLSAGTSENKNSLPKSDQREFT